jgi:UDP-glucose 4-epimerase
MREGHDVTVLDDLSTASSRNLRKSPQGCFIRGDSRDAQAVGEAMACVPGVFHVAASAGNARSIDDPVRGVDVNHPSTLRILQTARKAETSEAIFSASADAFGELRALLI